MLKLGKLPKLGGIHESPEGLCPVFDVLQWRLALTRNNLLYIGLCITNQRPERPLRHAGTMECLAEVRWEPRVHPTMLSSFDRKGNFGLADIKK